MNYLLNNKFRLKKKRKNGTGLKNYENDFNLIKYN